MGLLVSRLALHFVSFLRLIASLMCCLCLTLSFRPLSDWLIRLIVVADRLHPLSALAIFCLVISSIVASVCSIINR